MFKQGPDEIDLHSSPRRRPPPRIGQVQLQRLKVDWKAHFRAFLEVHGEEVEWRGRLWFSDGWSHAFSHEGPWFPPPDSRAELLSAMRAYWTIRRRDIARAQRDLLQRWKQTVALLETSELLTRPVDLPDREETSTPLHFVVKREGIDDDGRAITRRVRTKLTRRQVLESFEARLEELAWLRRECDAKLVEAEAELWELRGEQDAQDQRPAALP